MNSCELVTFVSTLACGISKCYSVDELTLLASIFTQLGDSLATIVTNEGILESKRSPEN